MTSKIIPLIILSTLLVSSPVLAEEEKLYEVIQDTEVTAEDLDIEEPNILPDSPFYFLKEWGRKIRSSFTFNHTKKLELENKYANEKLLELKGLIEGRKGEEIIEETAKKYKQKIEEVEQAAEKIKEKDKVKSFLNKYTQHQLLHQKLLEKLEGQTPEKATQKIKEAREDHLEKFKNVMLKIEEEENIPEMILNALNNQRENNFEELKNLEIMERIKEKLPENVKERFQEKQGELIENIKEGLENASDQEKEKLQEYIERIPGNKEKQMEIIEKIEEGVPEKIKNNLQKIKNRLFNNLPTEKESSKDNCIALWDPVCGKNGKTYSNSCYAESAGVEVDYQGECKKKTK